MSGHMVQHKSIQVEAITFSPGENAHEGFLDVDSLYIPALDTVFLAAAGTHNSR